MRKQFVKTVEHLMKQDPRLVVLLGDIGVFGFRNVFASYPDRIYNIGICEQAMASLASGMAAEGCIPVIHSIAPFIVERCFEQIKVDICYQHLGVKIVSVGASYDYASLGCTHHCPGDVHLLRSLPHMRIFIPGSPAEFDQQFSQTYSDPEPAYYRLSERGHGRSETMRFPLATVMRQGAKATIVAVGPLLKEVMEATECLDVEVLYYSTVTPFDADTLRCHSSSGNIVVVEPFYSGTLASDITSALRDRPVRITSIGVPHRFLTNYGHAVEHDEYCGLSARQIRQSVQEFIHV